MAKAENELISDNRNGVLPEDMVFASAKNASLVESRHHQIVQGACRVFLNKGYHPTTTREIAQACGMSIGQLYHYISCKDDVLYLVHKHTQTVWYEYLNKADLGRIDDPVQKLKKALYHSLEFIMDNRKLIQFIYSESKYLNKKHLRVVLRMDYENVVGFWQNLLEEVNRKKEISGDPEFLCSILSYLVAFPALREWTLSEDQSRTHVDSLVDFILKGLGVI
jgi:AcrR family transcriptional regulator